MRDGSQRFFAYVATLLHETCHAFLLAYGYPHQFHSLEWVGRGGHGIAWQDMAFAIEIACEEVLQMPLDLGRHQSLLLEEQKPGAILDFRR
jgi:hypothetical protein